MIHRIRDRLFGPPAPPYTSEEVDKRVDKAKELSLRADRLYEMRTGHPIGDVIERRMSQHELEAIRRYAQH